MAEYNRADCNNEMNDRLAGPPLGVNDALAELVHLQPQVQLPNQEPPPRRSPEEHPRSVSPPGLEFESPFLKPQEANTCEMRQDRCR